jgi:hypothetical protein
MPYSARFEIELAKLKALIEEKDRRIADLESGRAQLRKDRHRLTENWQEERVRLLKLLEDQTCTVKLLTGERNKLATEVSRTFWQRVFRRKPKRLAAACGRYVTADGLCCTGEARHLQCARGAEGRGSQDSAIDLAALPPALHAQRARLCRQERNARDLGLHRHRLGLGRRGGRQDAVAQRHRPTAAEAAKARDAQGQSRDSRARLHELAGGASGQAAQH